mmetsp:Transcript_67707/g.214308  ORF Transcript_67707/g.214308 Transcript_67707/m.214308 type:complete len:204 (+) Transcript_67707:147-758(+)
MRAITGLQPTSNHSSCRCSSAGDRAPPPSLRPPPPCLSAFQHAVAHLRSPEMPLCRNHRISSYAARAPRKTLPRTRYTSTFSASGGTCCAGAGAPSHQSRSHIEPPSLPPSTPGGTSRSGLRDVRFATKPARWCKVLGPENFLRVPFMWTYTAGKEWIPTRENIMCVELLSSTASTLSWSRGKTGWRSSTIFLISLEKGHHRA